MYPEVLAFHRSRGGVSWFQYGFVLVQGVLQHTLYTESHSKSGVTLRAANISLPIIWNAVKIR